MKSTAPLASLLLSMVIACTMSAHAIELSRSGLRFAFSSPLSAPRWILFNEAAYTSTSWSSPLGFAAGLVVDLNIADTNILVRLEPSFRRFESRSLFSQQVSDPDYSLELTSQQAIIELPASIVYRFGDSASPIRPYGFGGFTLAVITSQSIESAELDASNVEQPSVTRKEELGFSMFPFVLQAGLGAEVALSSTISLILDGRIMYVVRSLMFSPPIIAFSAGGLNFNQLFPPVPTFSAAGGVSLLVRM